jgi:hypothetical protein
METLSVGAVDNDETDLTWTSFTHMDAGGADVLFAMGIDRHDEGTGGAGDDDYLQMNSNVAVEANLTDWATFRVGAAFTYQLDGSNNWTGPGDGSTNTTTGDQDDGWDLGLGLGFNWGGFTADYTISQGFFNDPVSEITGYDSGNLTDHGVTLSYSF